MDRESPSHSTVLPVLYLESNEVGDNGLKNSRVEIEVNGLPPSSSLKHQQQIPSVNAHNSSAPSESLHLINHNQSVSHHVDKVSILKPIRQAPSAEKNQATFFNPSTPKDPSVSSPFIFGNPISCWS